MLSTTATNSYRLFIQTSASAIMCNIMILEKLILWTVNISITLHIVGCSLPTVYCLFYVLTLICFARWHKYVNIWCKLLLLQSVLVKQISPRKLIPCISDWQIWQTGILSREIWRLAIFWRSLLQVHDINMTANDRSVWSLLLICKSSIVWPVLQQCSYPCSAIVARY